MLKSNTMNLNFEGEVGYLTFKELEKYEFITHACSTRLGGVSKNEFESMNLSFSKGDNEESVKKNYKIFCEALEFNINNLVRTISKHKANVKKITRQDVENKNFEERLFENCDALITDVPEVPLSILHADCPVIIMIDPVLKVVGLAHAGWRGTVAGVGKNLVDSFVKHYNSSVQNIICTVGPGIMNCCFEFSKSSLGEFEKFGIKNYYKNSETDDEKIYIDLLEVNKQILMLSGIKENNIYKSDVCTMCNHDLLFSHRFSHGKRGTNATFISLKNDL